MATICTMNRADSQAHSKKIKTGYFQNCSFQCILSMVLIHYF